MTARRESRRGLVLAGVMGSVFLAAMESTVVATAMPTVIASLGGLEIYSWTFSAFLLASTVTMPLWGRLADQLGRRGVYLAGLSIFLLGSVLSGLSQSMGQLISFRTIQGLGAGSLITKNVEPRSVFIAQDTPKYRLDSESFRRITKMR